MKVLEIRIIKNQYGSLFAYDGLRELFQFEERGTDGGLGTGMWFFWPHGTYNPVKFTGEFPMKYFLNLCKAYAFVLGEDTDLADEVKIIEGKKFIK